MAPPEGSAGAQQSSSSEAEFTPLTAEEARRLRAQHPPISVWRVVAAQGLLGLFAALLAWAVTGRANVGWSTGYGAFSVVLPTALFARGMTSRVASVNATAAAAGFFVWEMVKIGLTVALLFAAPRLVSHLSWPAMLIGLIVTLKVYWLVVLFRKHFESRVGQQD